MPTLYLVAQDKRQQEALAEPLAGESLQTVVFSCVSDFVSHEGFDEVGCVVIDLPGPPTFLKSILRLRAALPEHLPVIVITEKADVTLAVQAMKQGAFDLLEQPVEGARLVASVLSAMKVSRARAARVRRKRELIARYQTLSPREKDVVDAVLGGRGNREVASKLGIKPRTVETHRSNAMNKLGARTLPDLVRIWLDLDAGHAS
ncbi:response regulator transcription factor [Methylocystis parvus]|uniref:response regulator transcription factor n=1 Tax=Methylocystis parvus TaxID=134 RepID=UPI003C796FB4